MRICTKCGQAKPLSEFTKDKAFKCGYSSRCGDCKRENYRRWYRAGGKKWHRAYYAKDGAMRNYYREWRKDNSAKVTAATRKYRALNLEKERARNRRRAKEYPEMYCAQAMRRYAQRLMASPVWANQQFISDMYYLARLVSEATGTKHHVDHIVPLKSPLVCGLHVEHNLQVIPDIENIAKGNRTWPDMP